MSLGELTGIIGVPIALLSTVCVPLYLSRRVEKRAAAREQAKLDREQAKIDRARAEGTEVSWEAINRAIVKERDVLKVELATQAADHRTEIETMRARHAAEIAQLRDRWEKNAADMRRALDEEASTMKQRYDEEMSTLATRLSECQEKVSRLYAELYELQKLLPPGTARPWPGPA
jgi:DNA anti-recombination protein RmuC